LVLEQRIQGERDRRAVAELHDDVSRGLQFGTPDEDADYVIDERRAMVRQILPRVGSALRREVDFGDGWGHDVDVEVTDEPSAAFRYPQCAHAPPPEDCGGVSGYDELRAVLADPTEEDFENLSGWAPPGFDADRFDLVDANQRMRVRR